MKIQHECVCVIGLVAPFGQSPFWGAGGSPSICVFVSTPSSLLSNWECSMTTEPPELVPEYPRALYSIHALSMVTSQAYWHAPTYIPESLKLSAYSWFHDAGPEE